MTDDEINRKVAEIEGWWREVDEDGNYFHSDPYMNRRHGGLIEPPPYATDWAWCGPLIAKYSLSVICADGWTAANAYVGKSGETPQRAICLAVIAAQPTAATLLPEAPVHDSDRS